MLFYWSYTDTGPYWSLHEWNWHEGVQADAGVFCLLFKISTFSYVKETCVGDYSFSEIRFLTQKMLQLLQWHCVLRDDSEVGRHPMAHPSYKHFPTFAFLISNPSCAVSVEK
jgi:hypothetical protein